mmetsp:Transcript_31622/g.46902  ORF Transcript_31622/g.46902 Transcript_31622/m.46902 type:complete len:84 (+) Transcript_31622:1079-1330(+)
MTYHFFSSINFFFSCLQKYCECFHLRKVCGGNCQCRKCANTVPHENVVEEESAVEESASSDELGEAAVSSVIATMDVQQEEAI